MSLLLNLALTDDQIILRDSVAKLLKAHSTPKQVRAATSHHDPELWQKLWEMGLAIMRLDEAHGGLDLSLLDMAVVAEEAGRYLACAPLVEAIVATRLLGRCGGHTSDILTEIQSGAIATLALKPISRKQPQVVPAGAVASFIIGLEGEDLVAFKNVNPEVLSNAMGSLPLASCSFGGDSIKLGSGAEVIGFFQAAVEEWKLGIAAQLTGVAAEALRQAADYSNERTQFGRKIGSFQGVAHPLADSIVDIEGARLLYWQAISATAAQDKNAAAFISMALWWAAHAAGIATERALHTFGGYGVSLENDIQLYYRRAKALSLVGGDPEQELIRVGDRLWQDERVSLPTTGPIGLEFDWGTQAQEFTDKLRTFMTENVDDALRSTFHHSTKAHSKLFAQKLAKAGFLFADLPAKYGGQGRSPIETAAATAIWEELDWNNTASGVTQFLLELEYMWGTEEAKREIAPRILSGEAIGCLGFSEPQSGSDIFGAQLRAIRDGDDWILNGQKMFTTGGHIADYILLLTRTTPGGAKHEGLTIFILPMNIPGIEVHPVYTLQDERTNITYFSDVRISDRYRLGEIDKGMLVMHSVLELEHGGIIYHYALTAMLRHAVAWAREEIAGIRPIDDSNTRRRLARCAVINAVSEGLSRREVWARTVGQSSIAYGPMAKLFATEGLKDAASDIVALAAPESLLARKDDLGFVEVAMRRAQAMTIYGGTSEIHRSLIAEQLLGMPKSRN